MGNLRACFVVAISALAAACGDDGGAAHIDAGQSDAPEIDAKIFLDAPPPMFDLTCIGNAAPTTATATIDLAGTVQNTSGSPTAPTTAAAAGVTVDVCQDLCVGPNKLATTTSVTGGGFSFTGVATNNVPANVYFRTARTGDMPAFVYPPSPFTATPPGMVPLLTFTSTFFPSLFQDPAKGIVIVAIVDCMDNPITDTTNVALSIKQNGSDVAGTTVIDASSIDPALAGGFAVFNVAPGAATTVGATYKGMQLRAHVVRVVAATTTETIVRPGY